MKKTVQQENIWQILLHNHRNHSNHFSDLMINEALAMQDELQIFFIIFAQ